LIEELRVLGFGGESTVVVSPDAGGVERARAFSKRLGASLAIIDKRRPAPNVSEVMNIVGDVRGKKAVIVDDIIDTGGTLCSAATAIMGAGAQSVSTCASHAVFSGKSVQRITDSPLQHVIVTNTVPMSEAGQQCAKVRVKSVGRLLGEAIKRIHHGDSISSLFV